MTLNSLLATWESGFFLPDLASLQNAAGALAAACPPEGNLTIALRGPMGAGKTSFVQGLAKAWGVREVVSSPTYNLLNVYQGQLRMLLHLDAWRLGPQDDLSILMIDELARPPFCLAVEWPDHVPALCGPDTIFLELSHYSAGEGGTELAGRMIRWSAENG